MTFDQIKYISNVVISTKGSDNFNRVERDIQELGYCGDIYNYEVDHSLKELDEFITERGISYEKMRNHREISCAKAHFDIIKEFVDSEEDKYLIIYEDDVVFHSKYHELMGGLGEFDLNSIDVLFFGGWVWSFRFGNVVIRDVSKILDYQCTKGIVYNAHSYETHAYLITKRFAKTVLDNYNGKCSSDSMAIDNFYIWLINNRKVKSGNLAFSPHDSDNLDEFDLKDKNCVGLAYQKRHESQIQRKELSDTSWKHKNNGFSLIKETKNVDYSVPIHTYSKDKDHITIFYPETGIVSHNNAYLTYGGVVLTEDKEFVSDVSWFGCFLNRDNAQNVNRIETVGNLVDKTITKSGKCLNLFPIWADINYYHYLIDFLGRCLLVDLKSLQDNYDYLYLPQPKFKIQKYLKQILEYDESKVISCEELGKNSIQFDRIDTILPNGDGRFQRPEVYDQISNLFIDNYDNPVEKIFIKRRGWERNINNEKDLEDFLSNVGFTSIYAEDLEKPWELFQKAKIVVSIHGAGLTNCVFMQPGTTMVEFIPENRIVYYYFALAHGKKLDYRPIVVKETQDKQYYVDISAVNRVISNI